MHVVKYACGKPGPNIDPETGCEPILDQDGEPVFGEDPLPVLPVPTLPRPESDLPAIPFADRRLDPLNARLDPILLTEF